MRQNLKLLIYTHSFAPKVGGVQTLVMSLARGLAEGKPPDGEVAPEVTVATPTPRGDFDDASLPFRVVRQPSPLGLARLIRSADVVHVAGPAFVPMLLGLLFQKPLVVEHSGYQAVCPNGLLFDERTKTACPGHFRAGRYGECLRCNAANAGAAKSLTMLAFTFPRRWMCRLAARHVAPTAHVGRRIELPRTVTIYHGVPEPPVAPAAACPEFPLCFAYVGRLVSEKGLDLLLAAAERLRASGCNFRVKFVGDGPERRRLEAAVDALGLRERVSFTGYLRGTAFERELSDVAVVVMPSIWEETAGLAAIEHMMRGRMVIAADIGGLGEVVDGAGLKFPAGNADGLTACIKRVIDEPSLAIELGEKARARAHAAFRAERMVARHRALYGELGGNGGRPQLRAHEKHSA